MPKAPVTPSAKSALKRFKHELAGELGVLKAQRHSSSQHRKSTSSVGDYLVEQMIKIQQDKMN